jgi:hypothetical protein
LIPMAATIIRCTQIFISSLRMVTPVWCRIGVYRVG